MRKRTRIIGLTLAGVAAAGAAGALALVYSGWYDSAATHPHTAPVNHVLDIALRRSISVRAADIAVPALDDPRRALNGFKLFRAHCVQCHGAPGIAPDPYARGMMPAPAALVETARQWPASEVYLVIRQGIKMTGMPAWQYRLHDDDIWDVVAFMKVLPRLSPAQYREWDRRHPGAPAPRPLETPAELRPGDPEAGRLAMQQYLCVTCHAIPGVVGANRHVGPPLGGIARQRYIAGVLPNTPANMARWLRDPSAIDPDSAMPDLGVSEQDARDMAAFLHTLDQPE